jgi:histone H3/H4
MSAIKRTVKPIKITETPVEADVVKRQQIGKTVGININPARVRCHLDKLNLNAGVNQHIKPIKKQLNALKRAKFILETGTVPALKPTKSADKNENATPATADDKSQAEKVVAEVEPLSKELETKLEALSRERTRFSNEASIALAIICDEFVQQFGEHAMKRVLVAKKKIIQVEHIHESGVEKLSLYPLAKTLPSFLKATEENAARLRKEQDKELGKALKVQLEKEFRKNYVCTKKKQEAVPAEQPAVVEAAEQVPEPAADTVDTTDDVDSKTSFKHYVGLVCKDLMDKEPEYKSTRVSDGIKQYLSDLLTELIRKLSPLINLTTQCMKNKTVNDVAVLRTVEAILIDGHEAVEVLEFSNEQIHDPALVKAEIAKRSEEAKEDRKYKVNLADIPLVSSLVATRKITYPTSGFSELESRVMEKLELFKASETTETK